MFKSKVFLFLPTCQPEDEATGTSCKIYYSYRFYIQLPSKPNALKKQEEMKAVFIARTRLQSGTST